jgi:uncharacterized protein YuzE
MRFNFYPDSDALYIELADGAYDHSRELDEDRVIHYAADGTVIGVKFIGISDGVRLDDVPRAAEIERVLEQYKKILIYA